MSDARYCCDLWHPSGRASPWLTCRRPIRIASPRQSWPTDDNSSTGQVRPGRETAVKELRLYDPDYYCEVTLRTEGGKFGFDLNNADLRDQVYGVFAEAVRRYKVSVFAFHFMSNHYHGLYGYQSAAQLVAFLAFLHGNLARLAHRTNKSKGKFWAPLKVFAVATDSESVRRRVRYIMRQAVAAQLVDHPGWFPGPSTVDAMLYGVKLMGRRVDATKLCRDAARLVGGAKPEESYDTWTELPVAVPHCWADLSAGELRMLYADIAADTAEDGRSREDQRSPRDCLISEIADDCVDVAAAASQAAAPAQEPDLPPAQPPKQPVPTRTAEDGGIYSQGPVKQRQQAGKRGRSAPPRLLAADPQLVTAYEERYQASAAEYCAVKQAWRDESKVRDGGLRAAKLALPAWMLLGTLPLRLAGDTWGGAGVVFG